MQKIHFEKRKKILLAAIAVPLAAFLLYAAMPTTTTYSGGQIGVTSLVRLVEHSDKVLIGTVASVETKQIGDSLYQVITMDAEKYLKDKTGENPAQVSFIDEANGCFDPLQKFCQLSEYAIEYEKGERAVVILMSMGDPDGGPLNGLLSAGGYLRTYKILGDEVQNEHEKKIGDAPKKLADLEKTITEIVDKQKA